MKRVVLCRPDGPRNVGMALRVALNFGPCELWLVAPPRASMLVHPEFEQMSHGAEGAHASIRIVDSLQEALADCVRAVAFTARVRGKRVRRDWRDLAGELVELGEDAGARLALVFGSEVSGLTSEEVALCQDLCHVRTSAEHTSLNLAMAVCVTLSDLYRGTEVHSREPGGSQLDGAGREFLKARLTEVFAGRVALTPSASADIEAMIERVFSRAPMENRDARAFHLILKALGSKMSPPDLGLSLHEKDGRRRKAMARREGLGDGEGGSPDSGST